MPPRRWPTNCPIEEARRLVLSPNTVQDHPRWSFEPTGGSPRHELAARIFPARCPPNLAGESPLRSSGAEFA